MSARTKHSAPPEVDCLGLGIVPLDILMEVPTFPTPDGKTNATSLTIQGGGPVPNCLTGLSRLGHSTALITALGDDAFAEISIRQVQREHIDTRWLIRKKGLSDCAAGWIESGSGRRTLVFHPGATVQAGDIKLTGLPRTRIVHVDGRHLQACVKLARWAKKNGAEVSFDIGSVRNDVSPLLPLVDHLVVADAFALPTTGARTAKDAILKLAAICPGTIVVTRGLEGQLGYDRSTFVHQEAFPVEAVDTTGAGDAFHVGYLHGLLTGQPLAERMRLGSAVAALKCLQRGARAGMPNRRSLARFFKQRTPSHD